MPAIHGSRAVRCSPRPHNGYKLALRRCIRSTGLWAAAAIPARKSPWQLRLHCNIAIYHLY